MFAGKHRDTLKAVVEKMYTTANTNCGSTLAHTSNIRLPEHDLLIDDVS